MDIGVVPNYSFTPTPLSLPVAFFVNNSWITYENDPLPLFLHFLQSHVTLTTILPSFGSHGFFGSPPRGVDLTPTFLVSFILPSLVSSSTLLLWSFPFVVLNRWRYLTYQHKVCNFRISDYIIIILHPRDPSLLQYFHFRNTYSNHRNIFSGISRGS